MKQLVLRNTLYERIYRSLGVVCIVMVIVIAMTGDTADWSFWVQTVALLLLALLFISLNFGTLVNRLTAEKGMLTIRWYTRMVRTTIRIHEIEEIVTDENFIRIVLQSGRIIRLPTGMLELQEKGAVRKFLKEVTGF